MSRKMKVISSVLAAMLLLTVAGATMAMAQEEEEPAPEGEELTTGVGELIPELLGIMPQMGEDGLLAKVAEILGIPEEELGEALAQARQEMMEERWEEAFYRLLDKAVEEGLLTEEEAGEVREWWGQKPEALNLGLLKRAFGFMAPHLKNRPNGGGRGHSESGPPWAGQMRRPGPPPWVGQQVQRPGPPSWVGQMLPFGSAD